MNQGGTAGKLYAPVLDREYLCQGRFFVRLNSLCWSSLADRVSQLPINCNRREEKVLSKEAISLTVVYMSENDASRIGGEKQ